jgi:FtsH-binding integral membrane protein
MMVTAAARPSNLTKPATGLPGRRYDHLFFSAMALLMLGTVFVGFAHTYYLAGVFHAPLPSLIIHLHGAAFSCWILLLVTQTSLVSAGRVDIHRRLGIAGFLLACLMVILGVLAATDSLARGAGPAGRDPKFFYIVPLTDMLIFATLIFFAFRARSNPAAHKRLILVATIGLTIAAIARWPFVFVFRNAAMAALLSYIFLLILAAYDLWSTRKVQRATLWAGAFLIFVQQIRIPIGKTAAWHAFATWVQTHAR